MLRDLILALHGHPGSIFKESQGKIKLTHGLVDVSSWERKALNRLLHLATRYHYFMSFIKMHANNTFSDVNSTNSDGLRPGCYLKGFCKGLVNVLLPYEQKLLELEKEIIKDPHLSFLFIQQKLNDTVALFDALYDVISAVKHNKSHGCQILDVVYKATQTGDEQIRKSMLLLLKHCHVVMYHQLSAWLLYGVLNDKHEEFFIKEDEQEDLNETETKNSDESIPAAARGSKDSKFVLVYGNLPSYITHRYASIICFIGTSLNLFVNDNYTNFSAATSTKSSQSSSNFDMNKWKMEGILKEKERDYVGSLKQLQLADEFIIDDFEMLINRIRSTVSRDLWILCVEHAQLVSTLYMLKDFYLLGRGELFLTFIDEADTLLQNPPTKVTEHDARQAFLRSAVQVQVEVDSLPFQVFALTIDMSKSRPGEVLPYPKYENKDNGWSRLGLSLDVQWPLHTLLKPADLEKYEQLFKFLLRVRRTQAALQQVWMLQMRRTRPDDENETELKELMKLQWTCRSHMQHFVDNLQYYLQADVLECHFSDLLRKIKTTNESEQDFEFICTAHDQFLASLLAQCFILSNTVCSSLIEILDVCQRFCDVIQTSTVMISRHNVITQLTKMWDDYTERVDLFFKMLTGVCSSQCNPHIAQLTLRLDYNKYFSSRNSVAGGIRF